MKGVNKMEMNEAMFITADEEAKIDCAVEALKDDILKKYKLFRITAEAIMYGDRPVGVKFIWTMDGEAYRTREFRKSPCSESFEDYLAKIKGYLFDVAVGVINLG